MVDPAEVVATTPVVGDGDDDGDGDDGDDNGDDGHFRLRLVGRVLLALDGDVVRRVLLDGDDVLLVLRRRPFEGGVMDLSQTRSVVLVLQVRRLVVHGPLELGLTFLVSRSTGASFLGLPEIEVA